MINPYDVITTAETMLIKRGSSPTLSSQAKAVVEALVVAFNAELSKRNGQMPRPTLPQVRLQAEACGMPAEEGEAFFAYFESNGWKVGRVPMRDWEQALCVTWKKRWLERATIRPERTSVYAKLKSAQALLEKADADVKAAKFRDDREGFKKAKREADEARNLVTRLNREIAGI